MQQQYKPYFSSSGDEKGYPPKLPERQSRRGGCLIGFLLFNPQGKREKKTKQTCLLFSFSHHSFVQKQNTKHTKHAENGENRRVSHCWIPNPRNAALASSTSSSFLVVALSESTTQVCFNPILLVINKL